MKVISIRTFGDPSGMALLDVPVPTPTAGQVLIEVETIGVGGVDAVIRRGTLGGYGFQEGFVPGSEVAGRVIATGDDVDPSWIGRLVWAFTGTGGGYAERAVARLEDVTALPEGLSPVDAVALGSAGPVAHFALAHGRFTAGESVLIRGAAGSIGITAVQLAALGGAATIAVTTSSPERGARLRELGATAVLNRDGETDNNAAPADEFDVILDIVGGHATASFIDRLADNGRMVAVGVVAGLPPADFGKTLLGTFQRSRSFATFSLNTVAVHERNRIRAEQFAAAARKELHAVVHDVLPLDDAAQAHHRMDAGEVFGRIVLTV
ncbi:NADPH:quinone reductase-like Zn-dependent oxidoreductase [Actinoplanes lutulentus]|uniref:NADPH:quinone reductase-like Zn-dependent oxidoreductase n=1 Tax=Actinoplanes lutulentus TaxID=1287878 RepID=A0A327Z3A3_9ACTN|nr:zinc-dependent alcohol dehydrogenase family protein [Actinoplanes lutulentus]MBB2948779.1 NADPH:quinone reductase-like Zn-dependent oxidoreductase [Actinoplanes lutulentus]RAK29691.1 NADPH:quinone reductase-like Zn-dependent oxidoreductase [Actinoplanes lutulentus]